MTHVKGRTASRGGSRASWRLLALFGTLALAGCSGSPHGAPHAGPVTISGGGAGPLHAVVGEGGTISKSSNELTTHTYGTELCSDDANAEIRIDAVRYDTLPALTHTDESAPKRPSIGTWFREVPPLDEGGYYPIISAAGPAEHLPGDARPIPDGGYAMPVAHTCDGYDDISRTWPVVEMLTQISAGPEGSIATKTYIDYRVGTNQYTLPIDWDLGVCGTDVPTGYGCRAKGR